MSDISASSDDANQAQTGIESPPTVEYVDRPISVPEKPLGYDFYRNVLGSPRWVVAPMVDASELPWRMLSRRFGADLCYTPMIHARLFATAKLNADGGCTSTFMDQFLIHHPQDRPLLAQFCANDPQHLLQAATIMQNRGYIDGVDLNLGCPQNIAKRGNYGAFLQENQPLIRSLIAVLHASLNVPVTAKIRVLETVEASVAYAKMVVEAGAQILTVHGRLREQKGVLTGLADWAKIKAIKEAVPVPVFANGNILYQEDLNQCLLETKCDGVMVAETNLNNPCLFASQKHYLEAIASLREWSHPEFYERICQLDMYPLLREHMPSHYASKLYLRECLDLVQNNHARNGWGIQLSAVRGHLFKMLRRPLLLFPGFRIRFSMAKSLQELDALVDELKEGLEVDILERTQSGDPEAGWALLKSKYITSHTEEGAQVMGGYRNLPYWCLQPYIRPDAPKKIAGEEQESKAKDECSVPEEKPEIVHDFVRAAEHQSSTFAKHRLEYKEARQEEKNLKRQRREQQKQCAKVKSGTKEPKYVFCPICKSVGSKKCGFGRCANCCTQQFSQELIRNGVDVTSTPNEDPSKAESLPTSNDLVTLRHENDKQVRFYRVSAATMRPFLCTAHVARSWYKKLTKNTRSEKEAETTDCMPQPQR